MRNINEYETESEWYRDSREDGYSFPVSMCHMLGIARKELDLSFYEVFNLFIQYKIIIKNEEFKFFIFRVDWRNALPKNMKPREQIKLSTFMENINNGKSVEQMDSHTRKWWFSRY